MSVTSIPHTSAAPNWYCTRCEMAFLDKESDKPCPRCGQDDKLIEREEPRKTAPLKGKAKAAHRPGLLPWERVPGWLIGSFLLGLWWAIGGKYTIEGLPLLGNLFFGWFHIPTRFPPITDGVWYLRLVWIPILISFVERQYRPWTHRDILSRERFWLLLLWVVTIAIDAGSTFLAIRNPVPDAWTITKQVAALAPLAIMWALLTTFGPESGLSWLWRWLRGA